MENSLVKKIGRGIFKVGAPLLIGGLSLVNSGCQQSWEYIIDGKRVIDRSKCFFYKLPKADLYLGDDYVTIDNSKINLMRGTGINTYNLLNKTHEDSVVINEAQKKVDYYLGEIYFMNKVDDSIKKTESIKKDSIQKAQKIKFGLDALK